MPEETLFKVESRRDRADVADFFRTLADELDGDTDVTLSADGESMAVAVPDRPTFEVEVERETPSAAGSSEMSLEVELEWTEDEESAVGESR